MPEIREKGYRQIAELFPAIASYAMENGINPAGPPVFVMDKGSAEEPVRLGWKGVLISRWLFCTPSMLNAGNGNEWSFSCGAGNRARIVHKGPHEASGRTYEALFS